MSETIKHVKNQLYKDDQGRDLICLDTTEEFAFLCPIDLEAGVIDVASVMCYSTTTGDTPIVSIEMQKRAEAPKDGE